MSRHVCTIFQNHVSKCLDILDMSGLIEKCLDMFCKSFLFLFFVSLFRPYKVHITQYKVQGFRNSVVHEMCSLGDGDLRGFHEMGSKGDGEFRRWGFHEMGGSGDGKFTRWEFTRWGAHEVGTVADRKFGRLAARV